MASLRELAQTAAQMLALFVAELENLEVQLPERQFVVPGSNVPWDGEQLSVTLLGVRQGQPGGAVGTSMLPSAINFTGHFAVNLLRSVPTITGEGPMPAMMPEVAEVNDAGEAMLDDASALVTAATALYGKYTLTSVGQGYVVEGVEPLGPEGGLAGTRVVLALSLS